MARRNNRFKARPTARRAPPRRARQGGIVLIAVLAVVVLVGAYFLFTPLNLAAVRVERDRSTNEALAQARAALIAYAVADPNRPGELPCPDVNDDGKLTIGVDLVGSACASLVGRLPWSTLGLPDLRDDAGERLWYALSNDFHANGSVPLNSDTAYRSGNTSLTLTGTTPAANLLAIVFAPGAALLRADGTAQSRGGAASLVAANYLDIDGGIDNANAGTARTYVSAARSETFNDRLMPVFSDDIMWLVEKRVAREIAQRLRNHYDAWQGSTVLAGTNNGFYPYAVPLDDPSSAAVGTNGTTLGMLPLADTPLTWSNASLECSGNGTATLDCTGVVACVAGICPLTFSGRIDNIATRFVDPPTAASITTLSGLSLGGSPTWTLNKAQRRLEFSYGGFIAVGLVRITVAAPTSSWLGSSWLKDNNWHQNAYYALSAGYAIDRTGTKSCGSPAPDCLTLSNTAAPNDDKEAVIIMTGRALSSAVPAQATRPIAATPVSPDQLLEGGNASGVTAFAAGAKGAAFNDYPLAVRP